MAVQKQWEPLPRGEVVKALEGGRPSRVPLVRARWWGQGLGEQYGDRLREFDKYPEDTITLWANPLNVGAMNLSWSMDTTKRGHDSRCVISDWAQLDEFIEKMPSPDSDPDIGALVEQAENARSRDMYILYGWWGLFFERPWGLRGMENIMTDYHVFPEEVARLHEALARQYCRYIEWGARNLSPDGFWTSDDLGHQTQLMMRPGTFRDLIKPSYARVGETLAEHSMHWWLHSCGDNTEVLGDLAEVGVNVFHPVQKGTMDEIAVAREFGDRMTFLAGLDVQHILQEADTDGVREEVRFLIDTFDRPEGGMCLGAGNGIVNGTPFENIDAFLDEAVTYGAEHRARYADGA